MINKLFKNLDTLKQVIGCEKIAVDFDDKHHLVVAMSKGSFELHHSFSKDTLQECKDHNSLVDALVDNFNESLADAMKVTS